MTGQWGSGKEGCHRLPPPLTSSPPASTSLLLQFTACGMWMVRSADRDMSVTASACNSQLYYQVRVWEGGREGRGRGEWTGKWAAGGTEA